VEAERKAGSFEGNKSMRQNLPAGYGNGYLRPAEEKFDPIYTAPECFITKISIIASDIWSYGILIWMVNQ